MTFSKGETVAYTYQEHRSRGGPGESTHTKVPITVPVKFIEPRGKLSALVELATAAGAHFRAVPLKNLTKMEETR